MRKRVLAIALASGCLVGLQATAFAAPAAAPQSLASNDAARLQTAHNGYHHQTRAPRLYDYEPGTAGRYGSYDGSVSVPYAAGH